MTYKAYVLMFLSLFLITACTSKEKKEVSGKVYSVDEFAEQGFKEGKEAQIKITSVTCYQNTCGLEGGGQWGLSMNEGDSKKFLPYAGQTVDMIIKAKHSCPNTEETCNEIHDVVIVENNTSKIKK